MCWNCWTNNMKRLVTNCEKIWVVTLTSRWIAHLQHAIETVKYKVLVTDQATSCWKVRMQLDWYKLCLWIYICLYCNSNEVVWVVGCCTSIVHHAPNNSHVEPSNKGNNRHLKIWKLSANFIHRLIWKPWTNGKNKNKNWTWLPKKP